MFVIKQDCCECNSKFMKEILQNVEHKWMEKTNDILRKEMCYKCKELAAMQG